MMNKSITHTYKSHAYSIHTIWTRCICIAAMALLSMLSHSTLAATPVRVEASLDSTTLLMGHTTKLHLSVQKGRDVAGHFPIFTDSDARPYATLLGDTIEVSKGFTTDTINLPDNLIRINYHVPIQVFDSGYYHIPPFKYVAGSDTALSNPLTLNVVPVMASATDEMSDFTDVAEPAPGNWTDKIPDFILQYWWAILLALLALAIALYLFLYWRKHHRVKPKYKPAKPPYQEAVEALEQLKKKELWQRGENELYFIELTAILRQYLSRRFNVSAPEMTTTQFLDEVSRNPKLTSYSVQLRRLLELADFIKFAQGQSLPDENEEAYTIVRKFVEDTRPTKEEEAALKQARMLESRTDSATHPNKKVNKGNRKGAKSGVRKEANK